MEENGGGKMGAGPSSTTTTSSWVEEIQEEEEEKHSDSVVHDDEEEDKDSVVGFFPGPITPLKQQIENDKDDESLNRWKEKLLGNLEGDLSDQLEPEVIFHSIGIVSDDCEETTITLPLSKNQSSGVLFTLKERSLYRLKLMFTVQHNIVSGLRYSNNMWKGLLKDKNKGMLGTFAPQRGPYTFTTGEETTPSGVFARGIYSGKLKFEDDDKKCHLKFNYSFEIKNHS